MRQNLQPVLAKPVLATGSVFIQKPGHTFLHMKLQLGLPCSSLLSLLTRFPQKYHGCCQVTGGRMELLRHKPTNLSSLH